MPKDAAIIDGASAAPIDRRRADADAARAHTEDAFRAASLSALRLGFYIRVGALVAVAVWLTILIGRWTVVYFHVLLFGFILLGLAQHKAAVGGKRSLLYALIFLDFLLMAFTLVVDNPLEAGVGAPPGEKLSQSREIYFFILLAGVAAGYEPARVVWAGVSAIAAWTLGVLWLMSDPRAITRFDVGAATSYEVWIAQVTDPNFVDVEQLGQALVVFAIVTAILVLVVHRARRMVRAQIASTRERANLARYFAPNIVESLANRDAPFARVESGSAAVLFADVVGFTAMFQNEPPERAIAFLRALHQRLEQAIFDHGGTLDKYMGDGVMAIFGAPTARPDDACRAIAAARAIQTAAGEWNVARAREGYPPARLSVGVDYGSVVMGDIGSARRLEFATIGDAVNLASKLESATRGLCAAIVVSEATARQAETEDPNRALALLAGFSPVPGLELPGHAPVDARALKR